MATYSYIKEDVLMKVINIRKKNQKGYEAESETIQIYQGLVIKLQAAKKNNKTCCLRLKFLTELSQSEP